MTRLLRPAAAALLALALAGCAAGGLQPVPTDMPSERAQLPPEHRVFYDALEDYGDWVLIEPAGYVFRPRDRFIGWRPYENGFWVPSDLYGWVWISNEPFGWAVYHYGQWFYDPYQGWVWRPDLDWGPAWVSWQLRGPYIGWSPLLDPGASPADIPGGPWSYAPLRALGSPTLSQDLLRADRVSAPAADARPLRNLVVQDGVRIDKGPPFELFAKAGAPVQPLRLQEVGVPILPKDSVAAAASPRAARRAVPSPESIAQLQRAGEDAARRARSVSQVGGPLPPGLAVVRPVRPAPREDAEPGAPARPPRAKAAPDSARAE
jgi:hypothetical protein